MNIFGRRDSVESIVAPISGILQRLHDYAEHHDGKKEKHLTLIDRHTQHANTAEYEATRARVHADKIASIA